MADAEETVPAQPVSCWLAGQVRNSKVRSAASKDAGAAAAVSAAAFAMGWKAGQYDVSRHKPGL